MKQYKFKINGQTYGIQIDTFDGNHATLTVNGSPYEVEILGEELRTKTPVLSRKPVVNKPGEGDIKKTVSAGGGALSRVASPLPGTIKKINVSVGDSVKAGDTVLIMEAMKMDNNINTDKSGTIKSIKVKEGDSVLQGDVLFEVE
ncbi:acetyl-CoA carboxylase biotin carboxyl carrier protein subunit [Bacteroidia bacterium]|nr:acetyl-CoA carboxylase biotin carboxyl carrier protein subunit [Bacteroidia bacterium]